MKIRYGNHCVEQNMKVDITHGMRVRRYPLYRRFSTYFYGVLKQPFLALRAIITYMYTFIAFSRRNYMVTCFI
jgi:hypothetical protein